MDSKLYVLNFKSIIHKYLLYGHKTEISTFINRKKYRLIAPSFKVFLRIRALMSLKQSL